MSLNEGIAELTRMFQGREWFAEAGTDQYGRLVVYTHYMCHETLHDVPDQVNGVQVLTHFIASKVAKATDFTNSTTRPVLQLLPDPPESVEELDSSELEIDMDDLCKELVRLEKKCGANILMDIFFEIHDGKNAVTNLAARYPEVAESLTSLYNSYGFDVIYNELEG